MNSLSRTAAALCLAAGLAAQGAEVRVEPEVQGATPASTAQPKAKQAGARATHVMSIVLPQPAAGLTKAAPAALPGAPLQIGSGRDVAALREDVAAQLDWQAQPDGSLVAAVSITSPGAAALRAGVRVVRMHPEATLRFYGPGADDPLFEAKGRELNDTIARNVAAGDASDEAHTYWSPVIESETLVMELELPAGAAPADVVIGVPQVTHFVTSSKMGFAVPKVGATCELDAMCYQGTWGAQMNAVARMLFNVGGSGYLCTGTLLADQDAATNIPYFLTANHCVSSQTAASTVQTYWFYHSTSCNSGAAATPTPLGGGATLLYASASTDTSFMRLNATPPAGAVYSGWTVSQAPTGSAVTGLHHPTGDYLRIAFGNISGVWTCGPSSGGQFSCNPGGNTFYNVDWNSGLTEPGSSGSGLFADNGKYLVGQLYGGEGACGSPHTDFYGRLDTAYYSGLSTWLSGTAPITPNPTPTPAPIPSAPTSVVSVSLAGNGSGTVVSAPAGVNCGFTCTVVFPQGAVIALTATPTAGSTFLGWKGACTGTAPTCTLVLSSSSSSVSATFARPALLTVSKTGGGDGFVTSSPTGIQCGFTCSAIMSGAVTLTATAGPGSAFAGWSGACSGAAPTCTVNMAGAAVTAIASFTYAAVLPVPAGATATSVEYYNSILDHYFMTSSAVERANIDSGGAGPGWSPTGRSNFTVMTAATPGWSPVCRFYGNPNIGPDGRRIGPNSHFYTIDAGECELVKRDIGWVYEGTAYYAVALANGACPSPTRVLYRAYNNGYPTKDSNHRYSTDLALLQSMVASGWSVEGAAMCVL